MIESKTKDGDNNAYQTRYDQSQEPGTIHSVL